MKIEHEISVLINNYDYYILRFPQKPKYFHYKTPIN